MQLLVDVGNHRLKWAVSCQLAAACAAPQNPGPAPRVDNFINTRGAGFRRRLLRLRQSVAAVGTPDAVWVASVAGNEVNRALAEFVRDSWGLAAEFLVSGAAACGVVNGYIDSRALGVDRWAGVVAACRRAGAEPVLVIDAGTAVTIDYVGTDRIFRGGVIVPGRHAMCHALAVSTAQLREWAAAARPGALALQNPDTRGAVENGVRLALLGAVERAVARYAGLAGPELITYITGGDADWLQAGAGQPMQVVPELVLEGVCALARHLRRQA